MHVAHVNSYHLSSRLHGELVGTLDRIGLRQDVFVPVSTSTGFSKCDDADWQTSRVHVSPCFNQVTRVLWPIKNFQIQRSFSGLLAGIGRPSLVHAHSLISNGLIGYRYFRKTGTPFVVTIRNTDINIFLARSRFFRALGGRILDAASAVVFLSPAYRDQQLKRYCAPLRFERVLAKSEVISNGIHEYWLTHKPEDVGRPRHEVARIVFAGKLRENKNLAGLLEACTLLAQSGEEIHLDIVGDGPLMEWLREQKECRTFPIQIHGFVGEREKMLAIYRAGDMLVVPSFRESFGLVYAEAMSQGLPVIYSRGQGFDGFFRDGEVGFAVDPKRPEEIADKIRLALDGRAAMSTAAFEASRRFSWNSVGQRLSAIYWSAVGLKNRDNSSR